MLELRKNVLIAALLACAMASGFQGLHAQSVVQNFEDRIRPILSEYCYGCHADGANEGQMSFDELFATEDHQTQNESWYRVLKQLQAGLMPPADEPQPSNEDVATLEHWIKYEAFGLTPDSPDPGRVTIRRLNQVEYRNTVRSLLGVDYDTSANFPADDTGHGFDNIGDVLSMSPLLLEKYVNAAKDIVSSVVPVVPGVIRTHSTFGDEFTISGQDDNSPARRRTDRRILSLSYYTAKEARANLVISDPGDYTLRLNILANETYKDNEFDENSSEFSFSFDGQELVHESFVRQGGKKYTFDFEKTLRPGTYELIARIRPTSEKPQIRELRLELTSVDLIGPKDEKYYVRPDGYERVFPGVVPNDAAGRREYAGELLKKFALRAFRRPVDDETVERLIDLAESVYANGDDTFEAGIAQSMTAILASPRFLFREEPSIPSAGEAFPLIDEYALASRLSYFLWSTMPDQELLALASAGELRSKLDGQIERMLAHDKSKAFAENFIGQWLRSRAIDSIQINSGAVLNREPYVLDPESDIRRHRFFALFRKGSERTAREEAEYELERENFLRSFPTSRELTDELRGAMRRETEMLFEYILTENRSLLELVDCDYTFLNESLWAHYQIEGIEPVLGEEMRRVQLPKGSLRGGVLTQGTTLVVTSNPDRTSPVKRGLFILENLLGTPPAAPPPNIPALEDVKMDSGQILTLRETLAIHRKDALCSSCHNQMDPLGLAFENFNAMGMYRTEELGQPIEANGELAKGGKFSSASELKRILATTRQEEIYRCVSEKLMTYALGRAVEYTDAHTIDELVKALKHDEGRAKTLVQQIIYSNAFQRTRSAQPSVASN